MAVGEHFEPLDRFAQALGGRALNWHQACYRTPVLGDGNPFSASDALEQSGEVGLCLIGTDFLGINTLTGLGLV